VVKGVGALIPAAIEGFAVDGAEELKASTGSARIQTLGYAVINIALEVIGGDIAQVTTAPLCSQFLKDVDFLGLVSRN